MKHPPRRDGFRINVLQVRENSICLRARVSERGFVVELGGDIGSKEP